MKNQALTSDATLHPFPFCTIGLTLLAAAVSYHPTFPEFLQYDTSVPFCSAPWQLLTWQWVHWSGSHAFWDIGAFAVLGSVCEYRHRHRFLVCLGLATLCGALSLLWVPRGLHACRGLSGIDSALFTLAATDLILAAHAMKDRPTLILVGSALVGFVLKTVAELTTGQAVFAQTPAMTVLTATHAAGAVAGVLAALARPPLFTTWAPRRLAPCGARSPRRATSARPNVDLTGTGLAQRTCISRVDSTYSPERQQTHATAPPPPPQADLRRNGVFHGFRLPLCERAP